MGMSPAARFLGFLCSMISCEVLFPAPNVLPKVGLNYEFQPTLKTVYGQVSGHYMNSIKGRNIAAFEGIPYAEKPLGDLRFANPEKKRPWSEPIDGTKKGSICIQMDPFKYFNIQGDEDCLYLNVYIPQLEKDQVLPVIVFIHGGFFGFGSGNYYGPAYLLDEDVILVTINYRLGPLGFVSTGDNIAAGNFGLKDQAMALGWVIENIDRMGGDRHRVVLMGHDAGGVASHMHMMSPLTQDLFGATISLSGNAFSHWAFTNSRNLSKRLAEDFWCSTATSKDMIKCLRGISAKKLVSQQYQLYVSELGETYHWDFYADPDFMEYPTVLFGPVIEHKHEDAFISDSPEMMYLKNQVKAKPWLTGITKDEGEIFPLINNLGLMGNRRFLKELPKAVPIALSTNPDKTPLIEDFYLGKFDKKYSFDGSEAVSHLSQMFGDRFFNVPFKKALDFHTKYVTSASTYAYMFSYKGEHGLPEKLRFQAKDYGVMHYDDLQYIFNSTEYFQPIYTTSQDHAMLANLVNLWWNFAFHGEPMMNTLEQKELKHRFWSPYTPGSPRILEIGSKYNMTDMPFSRRMSFWRHINVY